jgi:UDP-N-acetylmuramyl pentapeptide phosphotransferase/UDP-N-acetylglucosamine-1-phosphate transferase
MLQKSILVSLASFNCFLCINKNILFQLILAFVWSLLVALFAIPTIISVAYSKKILDIPNYRKVHEDLVPRLGGVAIFSGFMTAVNIFGILDHGVQQLLAGTMVLFFVGVKDDIMGVSVFKKFFVQVLACGIVMFVADIRITSFQGLFGIEELTIGYSYAFTFLVILCITNAINLIDGLDGLSGTLILISSVFFGMYFYSVQIEYSFVAFALAGGTLGFLRYNIVNAKIFMGDTGSLVCGFTLAVLAIKFIELRVTTAAPAFAVAAIFVPLFDTTRVFVIRVFNGKSPFSADRNHIHHYLLRSGLSHIHVVLVLSAIQLTVIGLVYFLEAQGNTFLLLLLSFIVLFLSVLLELLGRKKNVDFET